MHRRRHAGGPGAARRAAYPDPRVPHALVLRKAQAHAATWSYSALGLLLPYAPSPGSTSSRMWIRPSLSTATNIGIVGEQVHAAISLSAVKVAST
jgi:hypothetical protein